MAVVFAQKLQKVSALVLLKLEPKSNQFFSDIHICRKRFVTMFRTKSVFVCKKTLTSASIPAPGTILCIGYNTFSSDDTSSTLFKDRLALYVGRNVEYSRRA